MPHIWVRIRSCRAIGLGWRRGGSGPRIRVWESRHRIGGLAGRSLLRRRVLLAGGRCLGCAGISLVDAQWFNDGGGVSIGGALLLVHEHLVARTRLVAASTHGDRSGDFASSTTDVGAGCLVGEQQIYQADVPVLPAMMAVRWRSAER